MRLDSWYKCWYSIFGTANTGDFMPIHDYRLNQTKLDAYYRVADARTGSLAGDPAVGPATDEYLQGLKLELAKWAVQVQEEIDRRNQVHSYEPEVEYEESDFDDI